MRVAFDSVSCFLSEISLTERTNLGVQIRFVFPVTKRRLKGQWGTNVLRVNGP